jgi:NADPH2 dehydrogenase
MTRLRADQDHAVLPMVVEYYEQRSRTPGTLLIAEATLMHPKAGGLEFAPGIWSERQIEAWKMVGLAGHLFCSLVSSLISFTSDILKITEAVHRNGSYIFLQLWSPGRAAQYEALIKEDPRFEIVSASDVPLPNDHISPNSPPRSKQSPPPRPLTIPEIHEHIEMFAIAAKNAIKTGFDGVEIHGAHGYIIDQFLQDVTNRRTDEYGGSIPNRSRFALEVVEAVCDAVGSERVGLRVSPWSKYLGKHS